MTTQPIPSTTDDLIAEIEAAMANATPGYWYQAKGIGLVVDHNDCGVVCETHEDNPVDAIYIAACNPSNVRQLIARIRELEARQTRWREVVDAVIREVPNNYRSNFEGGNAPGHGHEVPGVWDSDNGAKAGTKCAWCLAWNAALSMAKESCQ